MSAIYKAITRKNKVGKAASVKSQSTAKTQSIPNPKDVPVIPAKILYRATR